jgi:hypothetical protein
MWFLSLVNILNVVIFFRRTDYISLSELLWIY